MNALRGKQTATCGRSQRASFVWRLRARFTATQEYAFQEMTTGCLDRLTSAAAKAELMRRWNEWKFKAVPRG